MKKNIILIFSILGILVVSMVTQKNSLSAGEVGAGSSYDPVVTKSYVDRLVESLKNNGGSTGKSDIYEIVEVAQGRTIIGGQGTEIILRAGEGSAIVSDQGGLQDMTDGLDITTGLVPKYHLIIIPRDDGRGIFVTKDAVFMVRGNYSIQ